MTKGELLLAIAGIVAQICLFVQILRLRAYREFPLFFVFIGFSVVSATLSVAVRQQGKAYFYVYWISEALYVVLTFLALQESFRSVFRNFYAFHWFKLSFPAVGILIVIGALLRTLFFRPSDQSPLIATLISLEIAIGFLQFGIFFLFIVLVRFFHMRSRQYAFGIVLGFGIAAAGYLVSFLLRSEFGTTFDEMLRTLLPLSYIISVGVWLLFFFRREPSRPERSWAVDLTPEQLISELRHYTKAVKGILGR